MMYLLKLELLKHGRKSMYWLYLAIVLFVFINCLVSLFFFGFEESFSPLSAFNHFVFTYCSSLLLPIAILIFYTIGLEFEHKIVHKSLVMGLTKLDYFLSKLIGSLGFVFVFLLLFPIFAWIYHSWLGYFADIPIKYYLLAVANIATYAVMVSLLCIQFIFLFKATKRTILFFFTYVFLEHILNAVLDKVYDFRLWFLPFSAIRTVLVDEQRNVNFLWGNPVDLQLILTLIFYAILFLSISAGNFLKRDLT